MIDVLGSWDAAPPEPVTIFQAKTVDRAMDRLFPPKVVFDPVKWAEDHGIFLWSKQKELLQSVVDHKFTAYRACHEVGKSFAVAVLIMAWIDTYGHDAFVVFTAPTYPQVDAIIGRELRDFSSKLNLPEIEVLKSNEIQYQGDMRGYGRKPADHNPAGLSGIHARYPLVVIDEGGAIPKNIFTGANTIAGNKNARVVTIGNPDNPATHFKAIQEPGTKWNVGKIDAFSSPNFTGEKVPPYVAEVLLDPETVEEWAHEWGPKSALYSSKVLAEFPKTSEFQVYDYDLIRDSLRDTGRDTAARCLTLDVASSGKDEAVAYSIRANGDVVEEFSYPRSDLMELADRAADWWRGNKRAIVVVDANGNGEGVWSRLKQLGVRVHGFLGQHAARNPKLYINARAEAAFDTERALRNDELWLPLHDDVLRGELPNIQKQFGEKNRLKLMSKEDMEAIGVSSPNRADAITMGAWVLKMGRTRTNRGGLVGGAAVNTVNSGYAA